MKRIKTLIFMVLSVMFVFGQHPTTEHLIDSDPDPSQATLKPARDMFDLLFEFPHHIADGEYAVVTDGEYIYTVHWNDVTFQRYDMEGNFIESFFITGASNLRDVTYDGTYFYGSNNSSVIYEMCFENEELISSFTTAATSSVRAIAYDPEHDGFWVSNGWNPPVTLIDRTGAVQESLNTQASSIAGLGWDNYSDEDGPYLWIYSQSIGTPNRNELKQVDMETGNTIQSFDVASVANIASGSIAGGMNITDLAYPGKWAFLGAAQNDMVWALELCVSETFTVTFEIEDEEGDPIDDAIVTLNGVENPPGDYVFEEVPAGTRDYKVEKDFYQTVEDEVMVDDDITVEVTMYPEEYTVTFDIIDDEGNPLDDAVVTLDDITNDPGDYVFDGITYGTYDYKVEKTGYGTVEDEVNVEGDITVEVILHPAITVTFDIKDEDGNEITEAVVTFDDITNDPGDYVFENIRPGTYDYKVEKEWYHTIEDEVTIEDDITVEVILNPVTFEVEFVIEDTQNNPIENATITLGDITNPAGDYTFDETPAGNYDYKVEKAGYHDATGNIDVYDNITLNITMAEDENYVVSHEDVELTIFPNPARDMFTVESNNIIKQIRLIGVNGQVVFNNDVNSLRYEINISNLQPGVYFMQIHTAESVITQRVQIAR